MTPTPKGRRSGSSTGGRARTRGGSSSATPPSLSTPPSSLHPFGDYDGDLYRPDMSFSGLEASGSNPNMETDAVQETPPQQICDRSHASQHDETPDRHRGRGRSRHVPKTILEKHGDALFDPRTFK